MIVIQIIKSRVISQVYKKGPYVINYQYIM